MTTSGEEITDTTHIGHINPFRYRGYYFSKTLGLYYLKSRFYDPETGRFISPDATSYLAPDTINGLNLYAYCNNNPVMNVDPSGCFPFWAVMCPATASVVLTPHLLHRPVTLLHDVYQLTEKDDIKVIVNKEKGEIEIANSHKIITPEVQYLYSLYLNHVNPDTKDVIKGTTRGMQSEWMTHNIGYTILRTAKLTFSAFGKETTAVEGSMGAASPANIGGTVFDNPNDKIGKALIGYNFIMAPIATILDFFVWKFST